MIPKSQQKQKPNLQISWVKFLPIFSEPIKKFAEERIYVIQASGDTKLSSIVRAIDDDIKPIYTEKKGLAGISTATAWSNQSPKPLLQMRFTLHL
jgi:hypothetical protein